MKNLSKNEERLIQYTKIVLAIIGLILIVWKF